MPNYKGHIAGGVVVYFMAYYCMLYYTAPTLFTSCEWFLFTVAGALFPDIDTKSKGQRYFYLCFLIMCGYLFFTHRYFQAALISLGSFVPLMVRHRGLTHQWWFIIMLPCSLVGCSYFWHPFWFRTVLFDAVFFIFGAASHLFLDRAVTRMRRT